MSEFITIGKDEIINQPARYHDLLNIVKKRDKIYLTTNEGVYEVPITIYEDVEVLCVFIRINYTYLSKVSTKLRNNKQKLLQLVSINNGIFKYASKSLRADREVVMAAINSENYTIDVLKYTSDELRDDEEIVLIAAANNHGIGIHISPRLLASKDFVMRILPIDISIFTSLSPNLYEDEDVVKVAVRVKPDILFHLQNVNKICNNKEFIMWAINIEPSIILYASSELRNDVETMWSVASRDPFQVIRFSAKLKNNKKLMLKLCSEYGDVYTSLPKKLQQDKDIVLATIRAKNPCTTLSQIPTSILVEHRDIAYEALTMCKKVYTKLPTIYTSNKEFALQAINMPTEECAYNLVHMVPGLRYDEDIVCTFIRSHIRVDNRYSYTHKILCSIASHLKIYKIKKLLLQIDIACDDPNCSLRINTTYWSHILQMPLNETIIEQIMRY